MTTTRLKLAVLAMTATTLIAAALPAAGAVAASDPQDIVEQANALASFAPDSLQRSGQGPPTFANWDATRFRGVRANYKRFELVNDRIVFCGELNTRLANGQETGWIKFAFIPGDPPILVTPMPGVGLREIGDKVEHNMCETGKENWISPDYTAAFQRPLKNGAFAG